MCSLLSRRESDIKLHRGKCECKSCSHSSHAWYVKSGGFGKVEAGVGGASLAKDPSEITLLDVFDAVSAVDDALFAFHDAPNPACPVGKNIHAVLDEKLELAQQALRDDLAKTTLKDLLDEIL